MRNKYNLVMVITQTLRAKEQLVYNEPHGSPLSKSCRVATHRELSAIRAAVPLCRVAAPQPAVQTSLYTARFYCWFNCCEIASFTPQNMAIKILSECNSKRILLSLSHFWFWFICILCSNIEILVLLT